jgi:hypothetical protein
VFWRIHSEEAAFVTPDLHKKTPNIGHFHVLGTHFTVIIVPSHQIKSDSDIVFHEK